MLKTKNADRVYRQVLEGSWIPWTPYEPHMKYLTHICAHTHMYVHTHIQTVFWGEVPWLMSRESMIWLGHTRVREDNAIHPSQIQVQYSWTSLPSLEAKFFHVETCKILILKWTRINRMVQTRRYRDNLKRVKKKEIALEKWYIMKITPCWERRRTYMPSRWVKE